MRKFRMMGLLLLGSLLVGCTAPGERPSGSESPTGGTCPDGLTEATSDALATKELGGVAPTNVSLSMPTELTFEPAPLSDAVEGSCSLRSEVTYGPDLHISSVVVTSELDEASVTQLLLDAGWSNPYHPTTFYSPDEEAGINVLTVGGASASSSPPLWFSGWGDFFDKNDVLLLVAPRPGV